MSSKSRSLPLTELANLFRRPIAQQELELKNFAKPIKGGLPSYAPAKKCTAEACGATGGLLEETEPLRGDALRRHLGKITKGDCAAADFNWPIVEAISSWVEAEAIRARHRIFDPVALIGSGRKDLVASAIVVRGGRGSMLTLDPRRANYLTSNGILVVQSLVHHLLRAQFPELSDLDIAVLQFPESADWLDEAKGMRKRTVQEHALRDVQPIPFAELRAGVAETLGIFDALRRRDPVAAPDLGMDDLFKRTA
jgi:hypothetical protein